MLASASRRAAKVQALGTSLADRNLLTGPEVEAIAHIATIDHLPASFEPWGHGRSLALRLAIPLAFPFSKGLALALALRW